MKNLPERISQKKHASLRLAYDAGVQTAWFNVFGKLAAEDATHPPPDDAAAATPPSKGPDSSGLPPELANLSPEQQQQLLMLLQEQMGDGGSDAGLPPEHGGHDAGMPPEMAADPRAEQEAPPDHMAGPPHHGGHHGGHAGMPPEMAAMPPDGDPAADPQMTLDPRAMQDASGDPNANPHMGADDQHSAAPRHTSDEFVNFVQQDMTDDETGTSKPKPTEAGTIPEKPPHWSGNSSLEGGDAGTRNYQMGLPKGGAV